MAPGWVIPDTLVDREGELGALGEGPFLKFRTLIFSSRSFSSPWRSPELNRLLKKFIVVCINSVSAVDVDMIFTTLNIRETTPAALTGLIEMPM